MLINALVVTFSYLLRGCRKEPENGFKFNIEETSINSQQVRGNRRYGKALCAVDDDVKFFISTLLLGQDLYGLDIHTRLLGNALLC